MKTITNQTRISDIIKANSLAIDVLAKIAKPFSKLKNPILRKVMTPRITLEGAAKIGSCSVQEIVNALSPLGFEYIPGEAIKMVADKNKPKWLQEKNEQQIFLLDVRPVLESGRDPLREIMARYKQLHVGEVLCVQNSFVPTPLIEIFLKDKRASVYVETINETLYQTYFLKAKKDNKSDNDEQKLMFHNNDAFFDLLNKYSDEQIISIDVRGFEMPVPMQMTLQALNEIKPGQILYVQHKRVPLYLLEELSDSLIHIHICEIEKGNVKLLLIPNI